jgi:hypothetical protein
MSEDNLDIWLDNAPVIAAGGSNEFDIWLDGAPVLESDITIDAVVDRRRVMMAFIS